jgi:hypothetical protein
MRVFKIRQDGFKVEKRLLLTRTIPILLITIAVGSVFFSQKLNYTNILPYYIPFLVLIISLGFYLGLKRRKSIFESYTLTIANNLLTREQLNTSTISIYFTDIKEIVKFKDGSFTVRGKDTADLIGIPAQIDNYSQLETALGEIHPIVSKNKSSLVQKYQSLSGLLVAGLFICVYVVNNKIIVGLTGSILVILLGWSCIKIRNSKNVDNKTRKIVWWSLLVMASVIAVAIFKLTGHQYMQKH